MEKKTRKLKMQRPSERQKQFLDAKEKYVIFGGARGGGKSWAVRWKAVLLCFKYPGIRVLIMRRSYPELLENHINPLKNLLNGIAHYNGTEHRFTFPKAAGAMAESTIKFMYCARDDDLKNIQGHEYDAIFIDEATNMTEYQLKSIAACVRGTNSFPKRLYMTCNPGGPGHQYIKRLKERRFREGENPEEYVFIQALVTDNKALMREQPDYLEQLKALPPKLRDAWLYGNWDVYEGQFFEEFRDDPEHYLDKKWTHVIEPFEPPRGWRIYRSFDWGYAKPFSCAWWAVDFDGVFYRILELYGCRKDRDGSDIPNEGVKWVDDKIFSEIARMEREHPWLSGKKILGVADPSIWAGEENGISRNDVAQKHRVYFDKGNNERIPGWMQCHYRLAFDENGYPMMYVFKTCEAFIRTIPMLCYDEHIPEDLDSKMEDHVADEWRYLCMTDPIKPRAAKAEAAPMFDPLNQFRKRKR
ncbi:MAG: phage terminase large subunit [Clostridia bacterium]|nr:phage terminase large subunit [Clostridia bacterium]